MLCELCEKFGFSFNSTQLANEYSCKSISVAVFVVFKSCLAHFDDSFINRVQSEKNGWANVLLIKIKRGRFLFSVTETWIYRINRIKSGGSLNFRSYSDKQ